MGSNSTYAYSLPPLPDYQLHPLPPLLSFITDSHLNIALPIIAYWVFSIFFHIIDVYDVFPQYRLHTPAEILKRNHVSRWEVFRDVVLQQVIQIITLLALEFIDPPAVVGKDDFNIAGWARWIRIAQRGIPTILGVVGIDAVGLAKRQALTHPTLAGFLAGGSYPALQQLVVVNEQEVMAPAFAPWEMAVANALYWYLVPALQFLCAIGILDTWQYFWHRAMHMNKWLYTTFHSRHHRLYVPYAYGALYNHPVEGFLLDIAGSGVAYLATGLTCRQTMWFFTFSTFKTIDDHCGYALPWDPLQHLTGNNAAYHDIHHQSWGIKTNFSQPFFTIWDRLLGTMWAGGDVSKRYERTRQAAEAWYSKEQTGIASNSDKPSAEAGSANTPLASIPPAAPAGKASAQANASRLQVLTDKDAGPRVLAEEAAEELTEANACAGSLPFTPRRSQRGKKARSGSGSLKGLKERMGEGLSTGSMRARMESS